MKLGIVESEDTQRFFEDIRNDLQSKHQLAVFRRQRPLKSPFFQERLNRYLFRYQFEEFLASQDVVFFEWASDLLVHATRLPKSSRIITRLHRYELFQWAGQVDWSKVDRVILVSRAMQEKFVQRFPEHADKTTVINESVSPQKFQPVSKPFQGDIGTLCFLSPRKRVYELILAFSELVKIQDGFHLHLGGNAKSKGDYDDALHSLVRKLNLNELVTFYGAVKQPSTWYRNIDIFVSNSFSEGLQVAPMEAMASARYTLSHHWDGAEELLPEKYLFLSDNELNQKILEYSSLPEADKCQQQQLMRTMAVEKFGFERIVAQISSVIEEVASVR